ncbi:MAG: hypothetical protein ABIV36_06990 [Sphingobium limneticum]
MTTLFYDTMLPAGDLRAVESDRRQLEILRVSGTHKILLRIGETNEEHQGGIASVELDQTSAAALIEGIQMAFSSSGRPLD